MHIGSRLLMGILDVASLYTSIPHTLGVTVLQHVMGASDMLPSRQISFLLEPGPGPAWFL